MSGGCRAAAVPETPPPQNWKVKNTDFIDIMISKVLFDLPFRRSQPLKSADDQHIRIFKNKLIKPKKKKQEDRTVWLSDGTCSYIRMYINAVADSVMLYSKHNFYNITFKIVHNLYVAWGSTPPPPPRKNSGRAPDLLSLISQGFKSAVETMPSLRRSLVVVFA
jgi:hypothetical protein